MTSKIISGNRTAEDIVRSYVERTAAAPVSPPNTPPQVPPVTNPAPQNPANLTAEFIHVPSNAFQAGLIGHYMLPTLDLDLSNGLYVSKKKLQKSPEVIEAGRKLGISLENRADNHGFLGGINWTESKQIVEQGLGARMLTPALYFPILKWAESNNPELAEDLKKNAEWLDAVTKEGASGKTARYLVHTDKDLNNGKDYGKIVRPEDKYFDFSDVDEISGLPLALKDQGKFKQWYPEISPTAAFRDRNSELSLYLNWGPSFSSGGLGVRVAKKI